MRKNMGNNNLAFLGIIIFLSALTALSVYAGAPPPTVGIISPRPGTESAQTVVSNTPTASGFKVKVQVWNDLNDITNVYVGSLSNSSDPNTADTNWTWTSANINSHPNYYCGSNCGIYNATLNLAPGDYWIMANALSTNDGVGYSKDQRTGNDARFLSIKVVDIKNGTGMLLARDSGDRFCQDCHEDILTHSSITTSTTYNNWHEGCYDCHTPHGTTNLFLIRDQIITPNSGTKTVTFYNTSVYNTLDGYVDGVAGSSTTSICQVCHTQTTGSGTYRWQNTGPGDGHNYDQNCISCHAHTNGFGT